MKSDIWTKFAPALALVALVSCGASNHATNNSAGEGTMENATLTKLGLTSGAFQDGQPIPAQYSCDGAGQSPPLAWAEPPPGPKRFPRMFAHPHSPTAIFPP